MATKKSGFDMDEVQVKGQGDIRKPADVVDLYDLPDKKFVKLRPFGPVHSYGGHWIETKKKDGGKGNFYYPCAAFDIDTGQQDSTKKCPWCEDQSGHIRFATDYFVNAIHRKEQANKPVRIKATASEQESGFKEKTSESWTPVKAVRLTGSVLRRLQDLKQLNTVENEDGETVNYSVAHPKYGADVSIKRDKSVAPAQMYEVQMGSQAPLTKEERGYLIWDLSALMVTPTEKEAGVEYSKWAKRMGIEEEAPVSKGKKKVVDEDEDDEDEDDAPKSKAKAKPAPKGKARKVEDDEDDFDDEDDAPKSKAKAKPAAKKKVVDEDDFDDEDEDEDDEPPAKSKAKAKPAVKAAKKKVVDEDDEDDDGDDEEDDEDDEPPAKSKKAPVKAKPAAKKKVVDEDDEDDFDDEDEDEDDEPPAKSKKAPVKAKPAAKPAAKSSKKKVVDEDEDDEDDEDED